MSVTGVCIARPAAYHGGYGCHTSRTITRNKEICKTVQIIMAGAIIIPLVVAAIAGLTGYLIYRYVVYDAICKINVNRILRSYDITKTPAQIVREFHEIRGEKISETRVRTLEKMYRQTNPDQFLEMYDAIRDRN